MASSLRDMSAPKAFPRIKEFSRANLSDSSGAYNFAPWCKIYCKCDNSKGTDLKDDFMLEARGHLRGNSFAAACCKHQDRKPRLLPVHRQIIRTFLKNMYYALVFDKLWGRVLHIERVRLTFIHFGVSRLHETIDILQEKYAWRARQGYIKLFSETSFRLELRFTNNVICANLKKSVIVGWREW